MLAFMDDIDKLWKVGSANMSGLHMQMPDGRKITIEIDGTMIREEDDIPIEYCDGCQLYRPTQFGRYVEKQGLALIWLCQACK